MGEGFDDEGPPLDDEPQSSSTSAYSSVYSSSLSSSPPPTPSVQEDVSAILRIASVFKWCEPCFNRMLDSIASGRPVIVIYMFRVGDESIGSCTRCEGEPHNCRPVVEAPHLQQRERREAKSIVRAVRRNRDVVSTCITRLRRIAGGRLLTMRMPIGVYRYRRIQERVDQRHIRPNLREHVTARGKLSRREPGTGGDMAKQRGLFRQR